MEKFVMLKTESGVYELEITYIKHGMTPPPPGLSFDAPLLYLIYVNDIK